MLPLFHPTINRQQSINSEWSLSDLPWVLKKTIWKTSNGPFLTQESSNRCIWVGLITKVWLIALEVNSALAKRNTSRLRNQDTSILQLNNNRKSKRRLPLWWLTSKMELTPGSNLTPQISIVKFQIVEEKLQNKKPWPALWLKMMLIRSQKMAMNQWVSTSILATISHGSSNSSYVLSSPDRSQISKLAMRNVSMHNNTIKGSFSKDKAIDA